MTLIRAALCLSVTLAVAASAAAETVVVAERTSFRWSELRSFEGPYSDARALTLLYGSYEPPPSGATWKGARLTGDCGTASEARVRVALSEAYRQRDADRHVLVTKATPAGYRAEDGGRGCAPLLGVAIFIEHDGRWYVRRDHPRLLAAGAFGEPPALRWVEAGPAQYALLVTEVDSQESWHYGYQLLDVDTEHPRRVLEQSVDWDSEGDHGLKSDLVFDKNSAKDGREWYDAVIWSQEVIGGGSSGPLKPVAGTLKNRRLAYVQGLYRTPGATPAAAAPARQAAPAAVSARAGASADYAQRYAATISHGLLPGGACDNFRALIARAGNATELPVNVRLMQIDTLVKSADRIRCIAD